MPTTTNYIWDEENYLAESDATNTINVVYTTEPARHGNLVSTRISGTTSYHQFDAIGSTRQLTNAAASVTDKVIYDAWGNVAQRAGTTALRCLWSGEVGYYYDIETALLYVRERIIMPSAGRWAATDPAGLWDQLNRYLYADNNPVSRNDPSGLLSAKLFDFKQRPCAFFCYSVTWQLDPKEQNGFIIQKVSLELLAEHCFAPIYYYFTKCKKGTRGYYSGPDKPGDGKLEYYEMWPVKDGDIYQSRKNPPFPNNRAHDRIGFCIGDPRTFVTATPYTFLGTAWFIAAKHPKEGWAAPPGGWDQWGNGDNVGWAGGLYSACADDAKGIPKPAGTIVNRTIVLDWNCCCKRGLPCETSLRGSFPGGSGAITSDRCRTPINCDDKKFDCGVRG
jgi:RHS repeat-associated protein